LAYVHNAILVFKYYKKLPKLLK